MSHAVDSILAAFVALLANVPGLEDHIVTDEEKIASPGELPWCWIQLGDEDVVSQTLAKKKTRSVFVFVDVITSDRFAAMQAANTIAALIEDRTDGDPTLGGLVGNITLQSTTRTRGEDSPIARLRMTYLATYWTRAGATATPV